MSESRSINLLKAAKELNIGLSAVVEFLRKEGYKVEPKPTTKLDEDMYYLLLKEYPGVKNVKKEAKRMSELNEDVVRTKAELLTEPNVKGKIDLLSFSQHRNDRPRHKDRPVASSFNPTGPNVIGILKWFDNNKGFGIIGTPTKGDYFLHKSNLLRKNITLTMGIALVFSEKIEKNRKMALGCRLADNYEGWELALDYLTKPDKSDISIEADESEFSVEVITEFLFSVFDKSDSERQIKLFSELFWQYPIRNSEASNDKFFDFYKLRLIELIKEVINQHDAEMTIIALKKFNSYCSQQKHRWMISEPINISDIENYIVENSNTGELLKYWVNSLIEHFDFNKYCFYYFTLTLGERKIFNKKVKAIMGEEVKTSMLKKREPWQFIEKINREENKEFELYSASWKSIWFCDGTIRICTDNEPNFTKPYHW